MTDLTGLQNARCRYCTKFLGDFEHDPGCAWILEQARLRQSRVGLTDNSQLAQWQTNQNSPIKPTPKNNTRTKLIFELRMTLVTWLLDAALSAAPKHNNEKAKLAATLLPYLKGQILQ